MKSLSSRTSRGVALVITLVMLAVVTLMAITFLAVSRRERSAVAVTEEQTTARLMADAALNRAKSGTVTRMLSEGNLLAYDMMVSTNFINPNGFYSGLPVDRLAATNVNYEFVAGTTRTLNESERLRNIANLIIDPRPPVYASRGTTQDFRFYLDLNRNGRFDTNGLRPVMTANNAWLGTNGYEVGALNQALWDVFVGDPEWIGVLQMPGLPHSSTNRFIGRYAYLVMPSGKSLDWNFVHNNALHSTGVDPTLTRADYFRNQGVGPWEFNLAGFLHELNTNAWPDYLYRSSTGGHSGLSFATALGFLRYRYAGQYANLANARDWFGTRAPALAVDYADNYSDGPRMDGLLALTADNDDVNRRWVGSDNPTNYFEINDLFNVGKVPLTWSTPLSVVQQRHSSYDRYTFYRALAQMGMETAVPKTAKVHLNYNNQAPYAVPDLEPWTPSGFFHVAANRMIQATRTTNVIVYSSGFTATNYYLGEHLVRNSLSTTNILIWPYNEYSSVLHRLLQLTVNFYDATTNRTVTAYPHLPTVLRPRFGVVGTNVFITGWVEVTNNATALLNSPVLRDLSVATDRAALAANPNAVVYNVPWIIGAKKGFPSFNEFALQNVAQATRKVQVRKRMPTDRTPFQTNLMYLLTVSNQFGIEGWNSYTQAFSRTLRLQVGGNLMVAVSNTAAPGSLLRLTNIVYGVRQTTNSWAAGEFRVPVLQSVTIVSNESYQPWPNPALIRAGTNINFVPNLGFYVPEWELVVSNRFYYALIDEASDRVVDFVCLGNMSAGMQITREIAGRTRVGGALTATAEPANLWVTNRLGGINSLQTPTEGVLNQVDISLGNIEVSDQQWRSWNGDAVQSRDKEKGIDLFREFCGLSPLNYFTASERSQLRSELVGKVAYQAPFTPTRKIYMDVSWQANDPLVHYTLGDLLDPHNRPNDPNRTNSVRFAIPPQVRLTNSNLGRLNERYRPWGGNPNQSFDPTGRDLSVKDPWISRSDDWEFPTNKFPNIGWLGRVHRGTPWQTFYLKADLSDTNRWFNWAGSHGTHPTNDWNLVETFTTALNDNAARGLLSVNQTNVAAWAAALMGVSILTPTPTNGTVTETLIGTNPPPTSLVYRIVAGINRTRDAEANLVTGGRGAPSFQRMGRILATPELTFADPAASGVADHGSSLSRFLSNADRASDAVIERIPQQILSLLKEDEPRFVVYAFGQTLREAPSSLYLGAGDFNRMCTNYQIKSEFVSKSVLRIEGLLTNPRAVVESYNELNLE